MIHYTILNYKNDIYSTYAGENMMSLADKTFVIPQYYTYKIFEVSRDYIARPDLISRDAYGDEMYGDIICKLNGISNPFELNEGMILVIPSTEYIDDFSVLPTADDRDHNWGNTNVGGKQKNAKRQSNEAVVGDTRFRIDAKRGVIIY